MGIGWKNSNKIRGRSPGYHPYTEQNMKHAGWCIKKGIKIAVIPNWGKPSDEWRVELNIKKNIHLDPKVYKDQEALAKMYEYYKYYYDKYNKE